MSGKSLVILFILLFVGCAKRPVLYPNEQYTASGKAEAERQIDLCMALAKESGASSLKGAKVAEGTALESAAGAVTGVAVGAVTGNVGRGAAIGAAAGGSRGMVQGLFTSGRNDPIFRSFVERCLRDRGYEPLGWN